MEFIPNINGVQLGLMIESAGLIILYLIALLSRVVPLIRYKKRSVESLYNDRSHLVEAAVVVFAHDDYESLAEMLPQILTQDYPAGFEVIVVNDGESPGVRDVVEHLMISYPNLYFTIAPDGARNLSRKKLALTLGVKASKAPVIVHTTSSARIPSNQWLKRIMSHFDPHGAIDVVIGYAAAPANDDRSFGAMSRAFDSVADDLGWIAPAVKRKPWRGIEHNLAYRRELFFHNKGFSRHLNLRDGDDDIFVSEIARGYNTIAEISDDAIVEIPGANTPAALNDRMSRRRFTKKFIPNRPRITGSIATIAYFLAPLLLVAVPCIAPIDTTAWIYIGAIALLWYAAGLCWNWAIMALRARKLMLSTPFFAFTRPIRIIFRTITSTLSRRKRYTWE